MVLPHQKACGYPYIGYGDLDRAELLARHNVEPFAKYVQQGYDVVSPEPTAVYCLKHAYGKLLNNDENALAVSTHSYEFFEYLEMLEEENPEAFTGRESQLFAGRKYGFHLPCHQRPLSAGKATMAWLRRRGAEVRLIETGTCCGMAGTFGMKHGELGYELAQAVGEPLFHHFNNADIDGIVTESSVCRIHLMEGTGIKVWHPLELLQSI